jgi:hypothetical protein
MVIKATKRKALLAVVPSGPPAGRRNRRRAKHAIQNSSQGGLATLVARDYAATLYDPWEFPGIRLGFGTMESTGQCCAYVRNSLTVNADGTFGVALTSVLPNFVVTNNSGVSGTTWSDVAASNTSAISANYSDIRIVSGGIRLFCLFPTTSASGVLFAGTLASESVSSTKSFSVATLTGLSSSELGIGTNGASVRVLPIDPLSYTFSRILISGGTGSELLPNSVPYIVGNGFPSGTVVWYEAVVNYEGLAKDAINIIGIDPDDKLPASSHWSNVESMYSYARSLFTSPVVMDGAATVAGLVHPSAGKVLNIAKSMMRRSSHITEAVSSAYVHKQSAQNTIVIEEMKDDARGSSGTSSRPFRR